MLPFAIDFSGWGPGDWGQVIGALFTALAAFAALGTVVRVELDRRRQTWPGLQVEVIVDMPKQETRLTVINYGGPAREVRVMGTMGDFGFAGSLAPSTYWQPGERRTFQVAVPPMRLDKVQIFVEGRDMGKRHLFVTTFGGATYRWPLRKAKKLSAELEWRRLFPGTPGPLDVKHSPMNMELIERAT